MSDKLKPCPFCGGEAEARYLYCRPYIICSKCHAQIPCHNTYPKAVEAWNTRKPIDKVVEQLEAQKVQHTKLVDYEATRGTIAERMQQEKAVEVLDKAIEIVKGGK